MSTIIYRAAVICLLGNIAASSMTNGNGGWLMLATVCFVGSYLASAIGDKKGKP